MGPRSPPDARARTRLGSTSSATVAREGDDRCGVTEPGARAWRVGASRASAASAIASATSARERSDDRARTRPGVCAPPPRGPSPSTVSGIVRAKWLASLAPPRPAAVMRRPSRSPAARQQPARWPARVHPRPQPQQRARAHAADLAGTASSTASKAHGVVGAHVAEQLAAAGTTLNASPERRIVGTAVRRRAPPGRASPATACAAAASPSSALRPWSGAEPECDERPCAGPAACPPPCA